MNGGDYLESATVEEKQAFEIGDPPPKVQNSKEEVKSINRNPVFSPNVNYYRKAEHKDLEGENVPLNQEILGVKNEE